MISTEVEVYLVDPDAALRASWLAMLQGKGGTIHCFDHVAGLEQAVNPWTCGCVVVALEAPGGGAMGLLSRLGQIGTALTVVVTAEDATVPQAVEAMKAGATDFLEKPISRSLLLERVRDALKLAERRREVALRRTELSTRYARLTPRERQVMGRVTGGQMNKEIAADLGLSPKTVEVHRAHLMEKMEAQSLAELVRMAVTLSDAKPRQA